MLMKKKIIGLTLYTLLFALSLPALAQQPKKIPRVGFLLPGSTDSDSRGRATVREPFRQGLREHGYVEGKNILIEFRYAENKLERFPELVAELVRSKVDVMVTAGGAPAAQAAKNATTTIPLVVVGVGDPVALGLVSNLGRPGGNLTGLSA